MIQQNAIRLAILTTSLSLVANYSWADQDALSNYDSATADQLLTAAAHVDSNAAMKVPTAISKRALELVLAPGSNKQIDPIKWQRLFELAEPQIRRITPDQKQRLEALLAELSASPSDSSFQGLQTRAILVRASSASPEAVPALIEAWLKLHDVNKLNVDELRWCLRQSLPNEPGRKVFSVVWTGYLTPPRSGKFLFSVSPVNVNKQRGNGSVRHRISATVAQTEVLSAGPKKDERMADGNGKRSQPAPTVTDQPWQWTGTPIELQAGQAVPIRVVMEYECQKPNTADSPSAILFWEGPGMERRPVASKFFTLPDRTGSGLLAEYQFGKGALASEISQIVPNIEYAWALPADVAPVNPQLVDQLTQRLWQICTDSNYLAQCAAGRVTHAYFLDLSSAEYLGCAQRRQFLQILQDSPDLLARATDRQLLHLYRQLRFGAEDRALDMVGQWMQLHADIEPQIAAQFFDANRFVYAQLADHLSRQLPRQYQLLQGRYLEMPDGRCALPVAYTLSYSYQAQDAIAAAAALERPPSKTTQHARDYQSKPLTVEVPVSTGSAWVKLLDSKLNDPAIADQFRINWLLARAQSAEGGGQLGSTSYNYFRGREWLDEARLIAGSDQTRTRIYHEEIARLAAMNQMIRASEILNAAAQVVRPEELQLWSREVEYIAGTRRSQQAAIKNSARNGYVKTLQRRKSRAGETNDYQAVTRYDAVLQAMHVESEQ